MAESDPRILIASRNQIGESPVWSHYWIAPRACECLWPDSDGDFGGKNLTITLHRL